MAIVFISPQKRKKILIHGVTVLFASILVILGFVVFLRTPKSIGIETAFKPQKIELNFSVLKSNQLTSLKLFEMGVKKKFDYEARTETNESQEGKILAVSVEEAENFLKELGLVNIKVQESEIGRINPFIPPATTPPIEEENEKEET